LLRKFNQTRWFLLALLLLVRGGLLPAQEPLPRDQYFNQKIEPRPFNEQQWKSLTKDLNYAEDGAIKESSTHRKANTRGEGSDEEEQSVSGGSMSPFWAAVFKWTIVLVAILILAVILYTLIGGGSFLKPKGKKIIAKEEVFSIENIEANLHDSDLDRHIRDALQQNNYTLAIRLYYLAIIKELSLNKWIKWKRDKTNRDYLREMQTTVFFNPYRDATRIFERVFYGNVVLGEQDFNTLKPSFVKLLQDIKKTERPPINIAG
jgi:hypothetical protein